MENHHKPLGILPLPLAKSRPSPHTSTTMFRWGRSSLGARPDTDSSIPGPGVQAWLADQPPVELSNFDGGEDGQTVSESAPQKRAATGYTLKLWGRGYDIDVKELSIESRLYEPKMAEIRITATGDVSVLPEARLVSLELSAVEPETRARILVIEGDQTLCDVIAVCEADPAWPGRSFVAAHLEGHGGGAQNLDEFELDGVSTRARLFFASWWRLVAQDEEQFEIRQRIQARTPYDIDSVEDPQRFHLDHARYAHWPARQHRPYHMVEDFADGGEIFHIAKDCISCYFNDINGVFTGMC